MLKNQHLISFDFTVRISTIAGLLLKFLDVITSKLLRDEAFIILFLLEKSCRSSRAEVQLSHNGTILLDGDVRL
jgi:hypothetical protein